MPARADDDPRNEMPVIVVSLGGRDHALPASMVEAILPRTTLAPVSGAAPWLVGLMDQRGVLVPVVDGAMLFGGDATPMQLGSRVALLAVPAASPDGALRVARFGLLCERVRERAIMAIGEGAWRPGDGEALAHPVSIVGRIGDAAVALIDPARLVATERLLAPAPTMTALPGGTTP